VIFFKLGLVVKGIDVRWRPAHREKDYAFRPWFKVGRLGIERLPTRRGFGKRLLVGKRSKSKIADPTGNRFQGIASRI
jgi:hypothetical protein